MVAGVSGNSLTLASWPTVLIAIVAGVFAVGVGTVVLCVAFGLRGTATLIDEQYNPPDDVRAFVEKELFATELTADSAGQFSQSRCRGWAGESGPMRRPSSTNSPSSSGRQKPISQSAIRAEPVKFS